MPYVNNNDKLDIQQRKAEFYLEGGELINIYLDITLLVY